MRLDDRLGRYPAQPVPTSLGVLTCRTAGSGEPLVLLHGIGSSSASFVPMLEAMERKMQLIAWDQPGYGGSDRIGKPTADDYAERLLALVDRLDLGRIFLFGHSLGALIAGRFARRWPDRLRGLILAAPAHGHARIDDAERRRRIDQRVDRLVTLGHKAHAKERAGRLVSAGADDEARALVRFSLETLDVRGYRDAATLLAEGDLLADLEQTDIPALILCGERDEITPPSGAQKAAAAFAGGRPYCEIPAAGHVAHVERPDLVAESVLRFVGEQS